MNGWNESHKRFAACCDEAYQQEHEGMWRLHGMASQGKYGKGVERGDRDARPIHTDEL